MNNFSFHNHNLTMASFSDTFNNFKVQAWLEHYGCEDDGALLPSWATFFTPDSPTSLKRKRSPGRIDPFLTNSPQQDPVEHWNPSSPARVRKPLQVTTRNIMPPRSGDDADPIKNSAKLPISSATARTPSNAPAQRRQSPRKAPALRSSARATQEETPMVTSRRRVLQVNSAEEARGRAAAEFDDVGPQRTRYAEILASAENIFQAPASTQSQSSKQSRSTSPSKTMHDLSMADPPIRFYEPGFASIRPPEDVTGLYQRISKACNGFQLLPHNLKVRDINLWYWRFLLTILG